MGILMLLALTNRHNNKHRLSTVVRQVEATKISLVVNRRKRCNNSWRLWAVRHPPTHRRLSDHHLGRPRHRINNLRLRFRTEGEGNYHRMWLLFLAVVAQARQQEQQRMTPKTHNKVSHRC